MQQPNRYWRDEDAENDCRNQYCQTRGQKTVTAILHENGYTVGPGKRKKTETGKTIDYFLKVYREDGSDE